MFHNVSWKQLHDNNEWKFGNNMNFKCSPGVEGLPSVHQTLTTDLCKGSRKEASCNCTLVHLHSETVGWLMEANLKLTGTSSLSLVRDSESSLYSFLYHKRLYVQTADHWDPPRWWEKGGRVLGMFLTFCWLAFGVCSGSPASGMKYLLDSSQALMVLLSPCGRNHFLPFLSWGRLTISCLLLPNSNVLSISSLFRFLWLDYPQSVLFS